MLSDDEKRAAYNRYGADFERIRTGGFQSQRIGGPSFEGLDLEQIFGGRGGGVFENGFSDFFEQMMGGAARGGGRARGGRGAAGGPRAAQPTAGENLRHELEITLHKAMTVVPPSSMCIRPAFAQVVGQHSTGIESAPRCDCAAKDRHRPNGGPPGDLILVIKVLSTAISNETVATLS